MAMQADQADIDGFKELLTPEQAALYVPSSFEYNAVDGADKQNQIVGYLTAYSKFEDSLKETPDAYNTWLVLQGREPVAIDPKVGIMAEMNDFDGMRQGRQDRNDKIEAFKQSLPEELQDIFVDPRGSESNGVPNDYNSMLDGPMGVYIEFEVQIEIEDQWSKNYQALEGAMTPEQLEAWTALKAELGLDYAFEIGPSKPALDAPPEQLRLSPKSLFLDAQLQAHQDDQVRVDAFFDGLPAELKDMYVDPRGARYGDCPPGVDPQNWEFHVAFDDLIKADGEWTAKETELLAKLTPEQRDEWNKLRDSVGNAPKGFEPKGSDLVSDQPETGILARAGEIDNKHDYVRGFDPEDVKALQRALGVDDDGMLGVKTMAAMRDYIADNGLGQDVTLADVRTHVDGARIAAQEHENSWKPEVAGRYYDAAVQCSVPFSSEFAGACGELFEPNKVALGVHQALNNDGGDGSVAKLSPV